MRGKYDLQNFTTTIDNVTYNFECWTTDVHDGFIEHCESDKVKYYNRSWQSFDYESVLRKHIEKIYGNNKKLCKQLKTNFKIGD